MPRKCLGLTAILAALVAAPMAAGANEPAGDAESFESSVKEFFTVTDEIDAAEDAANDGIEWLKGTFDGHDARMDDETNPDSEPPFGKD